MLSAVNQLLTISARPPMLDSLRQKQLSRSISMQARHWSTSSICSLTYTQPQSLYITHPFSLTAVQPQGRVFGNNRYKVERILQRMADADLNLKWWFNSYWWNNLVSTETFVFVKILLLGFFFFFFFFTQKLSNKNNGQKVYTEVFLL